jgi:hypothetical protein
VPVSERLYMHVYRASTAQFTRSVCLSQAEAETLGASAKRHHAWQQSWDQMLIELVQEEATFREVGVRDHTALADGPQAALASTSD